MQNTIWKPIRTNPDFVVLDILTTGDGFNDEICEVSVVSSRSDLKIHTIIKPTQPIPSLATDTHGVTNDMAFISDAPTFAQFFDDRLSQIFKDYTCVIYDQQYVLRLISQSLVNNGSDSLFPKSSRFFCAKSAYSEHVGDWDDERASYRQFSLNEALEHLFCPPMVRDQSCFTRASATLDLVNHCALAEVSRHAS